MAYRYKNTAFGGTFDLLHKGHKSLIATAFNKSQFVTIGITTDKMFKDSAKAPLEDQNKRRKTLQEYLAINKLTKRCKIVWLDDIFGSAAKDKNLQALVVSKETLPNAKLINKKRQKSKLKKLTLVICGQVMAVDKKPISSTRIREGEINTEGESYSIFLDKIAGIAISQSARSKLKIPFGPIAKIDKITAKKYPPHAAVGDITVSAFVKIGVQPKISVVDFLVERKKIYSQLSQLGFATNNADVIIKNPPGDISKAMIAEISKATSKQSRTIIVVDGEEDLAAVPAILLAPLGTYIYYGQPKKGAVRVEVNIKTKEQIKNLL
ncbi:MAG: pantetheine-phosphate adenylyltransferase [Candidatus Curtissbacteria bacterium]|nr:pantetheine-phosphate adenylyltransferase [Candidatus Curtissbacteria bacterium]